MLGIASLATGRAEYYLEAVAAGREDYYLGSGEAPGYWLGANATTLGLVGEIEADQLRALLDGDDPISGVRLARTRKGRTPGFDLTFSAPKSVSLLNALASPDISRAVSAAHDSAVAETLGWLEANACAVRRGAGGTNVEAGDGFVAAAFRHRTSRAGDPHLHTHLLIANLTRGPDGRWCAPDARRFWALGNTASYLYEATLRHELTVALGVEFGPVTNGIADLAGISRACIETFSQRRALILERLDDLGLDSARAAQFATLDTRDAKTAFDIEALRVDWVEIAADFDTTTETLDSLTGQSNPAPIAEATVERVIEGLVSDTGLTTNASTFDRRHVLRAWCEHFPQGAPIEQIEQLADRTLAHPQIVELAGTATTAMRRDDHRPMRAPALGSRYSTHSLLELEQQILDLADRQAAARLGIVDPSVVEVATHRRSLNPEQAEMVRALTGSGRGIEIVIAPAGSGKTYALGAARDAWNASTYPVIGCSLAARAAQQLQHDTAIPATTIANLRRQLCQGWRFPANSVLVIDEAAMAGTRTLAPLITAAVNASAKVVLVGDTRQLSEIDAGGLVRGLDHQLGGIHLTRNQRQHHPWERAALAQLRAGMVQRSIDAYLAHDRLSTAPTARALRARLAGDYVAAHRNGERVLMLATRRSDVADLNRRARALLTDHHTFSGPVLDLSGKPFQAGDRIICTRNQHRLGITNGTTATIIGVDTDCRTITARRDRGATITLPAAYLDAGHVQHGYATTIHKAQGQTLDRAFILTNGLNRESGYTALSRGRIENRLYAVVADNEHDHGHTRTPDPIDDLRRDLTTSSAQELATTYRHPAAPTRSREPDLDLGIEL
ncbi:MAG: MobF family relaxase [Actinomycetota bacterium]